MNRGSIASWFARKVSVASWDRTPFVDSYHIDELSIISKGIDADISAGIALLRKVDDLRRSHGVNIELKLAIPFGVSDELDTDPVSLTNVVTPPVYEPPSLYLFGSQHFRVPNDREEYFCPYRDTPWGGDILATYSCGRSMLDRDLGWEFSKTVWISLVGV